MPGDPPAHQPPCAFIVGDFNVGKSTLINALIRRDLLHTSREEGRAVPTFIGRSGDRHDHFSAMETAGGAVTSRTHEEFLRIRHETGKPAAARALTAACGNTPFRDLLLVDTSGMSSDACESAEITDLRDGDGALLLVVADIEYWAAKHTMEFVSVHQEHFGDRLYVVANKADHLNASEIERIREKAAQRMEDYGIEPAPRFFTLSARLEAARRTSRDEYRNRTKARVRELCDGGFDALRVALYEFEAAQCHRDRPDDMAEWVQSPLATSFIATQEGIPA